MQKNTLWGFVLIGIILIGFGWYNSWNYKKQVRAAFVRDSLARVEALTNPRVADSIRIADSLRDVLNGVVPASSVVTENVAAVPEDTLSAPVYTDSLLEVSSKLPEEVYTLENEKLRIDVSTKGAQIKNALVKQYYTYDSTALYLVKEGLSEMSLTFFTDQRINTSNFTFTKVAQSDSSLTLRLAFNGGAYMDYVYTLPKESYLLGFNVVTKGMSGIIPRNAQLFDFDWNLKISRFEKGYDNEKNYSTVDYKYPNDKSVENLGLRRSESDKKIPTKLSWFSFHQQFFSAIMVADNNFTEGTLSYKFFDSEDTEHLLMDCNAHMIVDYPGGDEAVIPFHIYLGPNLYKELKSYNRDFERIVPLGKHIIGWINRAIIINLFDFLRRFISNYGIIILIMTLIIKLVLSPLTFKSYLSSAKMKVLKPEIEKINAKYPRKDDALKKQQETMALYQKTGVNMMGGCLPMLLQIPILFAIFKFFPVSFELRQHPFLWASDLSGYDSILDLGFSIPMYGNHVSLFALLMAISMYFYSRINIEQMPDNGQMAGMKGMQLYFMPIFMLVLCNNFSAGLSYYYMLTNLITILQTWIIRKYFVDEDKLRMKLMTKAASKSSKKSKWRERMEQMMKEQERLQKERSRSGR